MLKYDSEEMRLTCAGTTGELLADVAAMTMRVLYNMAGGDKAGVQHLLTMYVSALMHACHDDEAWEILDTTEKQATTVDLSHLRDALKKNGEQ